MRVSQAYSTLILLTLALSREGRGKRIRVKGVNAFVLETLCKSSLPRNRIELVFQLDLRISIEG